MDGAGKASLLNPVGLGVVRPAEGDGVGDKLALLETEETKEESMRSGRNSGRHGRI